jgi:hypothetical protein
MTDRHFDFPIIEMIIPPEAKADQWKTTVLVKKRSDHTIAAEFPMYLP